MVKGLEAAGKPVLLAYDGPYRFTVDQYHKMGEVGVFPPDAKVELMDGQVLPVSIGNDHAFVVNRPSKLLLRRLAEDAASISIQNPLTVSGDSEPLPDLLVLKYRADDYQHRLPNPEDTLLVIEVSDTTLRYDQSQKKCLSTPGSTSSRAGWWT